MSDENSLSSVIPKDWQGFLGELPSAGLAFFNL